MRKFFKHINEISSIKLITLTALFLIIFDNIRFFANVIDIYSLHLKNVLFLFSLFILFGTAIIFQLSLFCYKYTIKPILISILLLSSLAAYFMDSYKVVIDADMIQNIFSTDLAETMDLISLKMLVYFILLGVFPSLFVFKLTIVYATGKKEIVTRIKLILVSLALALFVLFIFGNFYASFFREHKPLRYYANPSGYMYATGKYIARFLKGDTGTIQTIGADAKVSSKDMDRELVIFVVGEGARADRFSLNGYKKETNPLLKKEDVISFSNFWSCGTSTEVSVPCMFSIYTQSQYSKNRAKSTENLLDVLTHAGVNVIWLDNNSSSKDVALRVPYQSYKKSKRNPVCDIECRDEGMLANMQTYIDEHSHGDIFIILHQMGNHGPAYYKRYPPAFEKFKPTCETNQLEDCSKEEIDNTYDNAILYTDYFLDKVIKILKNNNALFETAMFYVSDHGESLGEYGIYLHGMPNFIAPDAQRHVPAIMWFGKNFKGIDIKLLKEHSRYKYTHDNIFHTVLGFMEIKTSIYEKEMDILYSARNRYRPR